MKKFAKKIISALLCLITLFCFGAVSAFAENTTDSYIPPPVDESKSVNLYPNATEVSSEEEGVVELDEVNIAKKNARLKVAKSYSKTFKMKDNAFSVTVSDVGGDYNLAVIKSDDSWAEIFPSRAHDTTFTFTGCTPGAKYTVYVINREVKAVTPTIKIGSFMSE